MTTDIRFPQGPFLNGNVPALEWEMWLQSPQFIEMDLATALSVTNGGTGLTSGTSGGVLAFTATTTLASSALLTANAIMLGGGAGFAPSTPVGLGTTTTVLHGNASGAPTWGKVDLTTDVSQILPVAYGGTGKATLTANGVVVGNGTGAVNITAAGAANTVLRGNGAADPTFGAVVLASADFANQGTTTTVLHGNAAGNPSFGKVSLTADISGTLTVANGGTGVATLTGIPLASGTTAFTALDYVAWTSPAFSAGDFTANGAMTWTVASGDVVTYKYTIVGKTMTVNWFLQTTSVGGTPDTTLMIAIPASKVSAVRVYTPIAVYENAAAIGYAEVTAGGTTINLYTTTWATSTNWTGTTDTTFVSGSITFEIQ